MKSGISVVVTGATGMVGGHALKLCLERPEVSSITVVGRRSVGVKHEKLHEVLHGDFSDCDPIAEALGGHDAAVYCVGAYTGAVPDDEFRKITVDYTIEFGRALHAQSPQCSFCFLSGQGADQTEQSRIAFARYKGSAEKALLSMGFPRVAIFRPGYIYPVTPRNEPNLMYRISRVLYPVLRIVYPNIGISSEDLAQAMVNLGLDESLWKGPVLENRDIRELASR
jgi:uncharacterized protein YbjT (DUF2867 family)